MERFPGQQRAWSREYSREERQGRRTVPEQSCPSLLFPSLPSRGTQDVPLSHSGCLGQVALLGSHVWPPPEAAPESLPAFLPGHFPAKARGKAQPGTLFPGKTLPGDPRPGKEALGSGFRPIMGRAESPFPGFPSEGKLLPSREWDWGGYSPPGSVQEPGGRAGKSRDSHKQLPATSY